MPEDSVQPEHRVIGRGATCKRILITILFVFVERVVTSLLAVVIVFELLFTLITGRTPGERVVGFAHRVVRYRYEIGQYLTYNKDQPPFPFDDFATVGDAAPGVESEGAA